MIYETLPPESRSTQNQMLAQNYDSQEPVWFLSRDRQRLHRFDQLVDSPIERQIYFSPSAFPRVNKFDMWKGSCFRDWVVPTSAYILRHHQGQVLDIDRVRRDTDIHEYRQFLIREIQQQIHDIYQQHPTVNLFHSGGVDSTVILAFVMSLGYSHRTQLICVENLATQHTKSLRYDRCRLDNIKNLYQDQGSNFLNTVMTSIDVNDIITMINSGRDYFHMQNYVTSAMFDRHTSQAWLGGGHGNRTLLHQEIFLDAMRESSIDRAQHIRQTLQDLGHDLYLDHDHLPDFVSPPQQLENISHAIKYFDKCDGWRNNRLYSPLGSESCFQLLRRLDFDEITVEHVVCAEFAKDIIRDRAPELLRWCDKQQSNHDFNVLQDIPALPYDKLDLDQLWLPESLCHDREGLDWIHWCLSEAKRTNAIDINVLVSIKNLQLIHQRVNNL